MTTFKLPYKVQRWRDMKYNDDPTEYMFISEIMERDQESKRTVCWNLLERFSGESSPTIDDFDITSVFFSDQNLLVVMA